MSLYGLTDEEREEQAAQVERDKIVAWLREHGWLTVARQIDNGEHE